MVNSDTNFYEHIDNFAKFSNIGWRCIFGDVNLLETVSITISIPTFNRPDTLKDAVDSALNQRGHDDFCVLVVDNNPMEDTETTRLMEAYHSKKLLYFKNNENIGMFGNQNRCFEIPKSEYVVLLHDDDMLLPNYLYECDRVLDDRIDYLQPRKIMWHEDKGDWEKLVPAHISGKIKRIRDVDQYMYFRFGSPTGGLFRRKSMIEIGGFNSDYYPTADYCTSVQLSEKKTCVVLSEPLIIYRIGRNASLKQDTLELFVHNDFYLRKQIFKKLKLNRISSNVLLSYIVYSQYEGLRDKYNPDFIFDFGSLGLKKPCPRYLYLVFRLYSAIKVKLFRLVCY